MGDGAGGGGARAELPTSPPSPPKATKVMKATKAELGLSVPGVVLRGVLRCGFGGLGFDWAIHWRRRSAPAFAEATAGRYRRSLW